MFAAPRAPSGSVENEYAVKKSCMFYKHKKYIPVMLAKIKKKKKKNLQKRKFRTWWCFRLFWIYSNFFFKFHLFDFPDELSNQLS